MHTEQEEQPCVHLFINEAKGYINMKEQLKKAFESIRNGNVEEAALAVEEIKKLPRTVEGIFDLTTVDENTYEAARWVYPVYAAYETVCNKKEGYPDILAQQRVIAEMLKKNYSFENAASVLDMLIHTIDCMSPEIYEYYRELVDIFKENVREVIKQYYPEGFTAVNGAKEVPAEKLFHGAVAEACRKNILLAEKYQVFC